MGNRRLCFGIAVAAWLLAIGCGVAIPGAKDSNLGDSSSVASGTDTPTATATDTDTGTGTGDSTGTDTGSDFGMDVGTATELLWPYSPELRFHVKSVTDFDKDDNVDHRKSYLWTQDGRISESSEWDRTGDVLEFRQFSRHTYDGRHLVATESWADEARTRPTYVFNYLYGDDGKVVSSTHKAFDRDTGALTGDGETLMDETGRAIRQTSHVYVGGALTTTRVETTTYDDLSRESSWTSVNEENGVKRESRAYDAATKTLVVTSFRPPAPTEGWSVEETTYFKGKVEKTSRNPKVPEEDDKVCTYEGEVYQCVTTRHFMGQTAPKVSRKTEMTGTILPFVVSPDYTLYLVLRGSEVVTDFDVNGVATYVTETRLTYNAKNLVTKRAHKRTRDPTTTPSLYSYEEDTTFDMDGMRPIEMRVTPGQASGGPGVRRRTYEY